MSTATLDTTTVRRWKRYPEARALPLDWTLTIPAHWKIRRLKEVASVRPSNVDKKSVEGERAVQLCNYVDVYKNDMITADMEFMPATATEAQIAQFSIRAGDVIITKDSETWDDIAVPAYVPETIDGLVCGYHLALIRADTRCLNGAYLARCFAAEGLADQFRVAANGITRYGLDTQSVKCAVFPVPPLSEQRAIAAFLDRETARIDALIGHKERLIALLEEKRQAVISHAVTRGLDPSAPLKDSDAEWLAKKPGHWTVRKVKHLARNEPGAFIDGDWIESPYITNDGIRLIQCGNVGTGVYEEQGFRYISDETYRELNCTEVAAGDVLICRMRSSPRILAGRACVAPDLGVRMVTAVDNCILKPATGFDSRFLVYQMSTSAYLKYIEAIARGGTRDRISRSMLADIKLVIPPLPEQRTIADHLDGVCSGFGHAADRIRDGIARLQEYRTALISAAVTGQIDVRGEVNLGEPGA